MQEKPHICTIDQLAKETNISAYTIRKWVKSGELKHIRSGIKYLINYDVFMSFLNGTETESGETKEKVSGIRPVMSL